MKAKVLSRRTVTYAAIVSVIVIAASVTGAEAGSHRRSGTPDSEEVESVVPNAAVAAPGALPADSRFAPTETTVFRLAATLTEYKLEEDSDFHLILSDGAGHTLISEIPDPVCVGAGSPLAGSISDARAAFDARYTATGRFQTANVPVTVTGVGFFDFLHGQTSVVPNGMELHAVLDVTFTAVRADGGPQRHPLRVHRPPLLAEIRAEPRRQRLLRGAGCALPAPSTRRAAWLPTAFGPSPGDPSRPA